jgi:photosystem II oxygen-evolving enhancer protein 2
MEMLLANFFGNIDMLKRTFFVALMVLSFTLSGCVSGASGLKAYVDSLDGYQFLYPNGWVPVQVASGADVVFHDLIQTTENVSVVVSSVSGGKTLTDLGTPEELGQKLAKTMMPANSSWTAELVGAIATDAGTQTYYNLEYLVRRPNPSASTGEASFQERHQLASVAVSRGKLYTLSLSAPEERWPRIKDLFRQVAGSFSVY